jgi:predicted  nucleic acid-binding Zn-ribbon protein
MKIETAKGLEKQVKEAARTLEATERLIRDLQIQVSTVQDDDTLKRLEMRIAKLNYRLNQEKEALMEAERRLKQAKLDFQRFGEKNTL